MLFSAARILILQLYPARASHTLFFSDPTTYLSLVETMGDSFPVEEAVVPADQQVGAGAQL